MSRRRAGWRALLLAALLLPLSCAPASAQRLILDGRLGIALPAGELDRLVKVGSAFGAGVGYRFDPRLAVRLDIETDFLQGEDIRSPAGAGPALVLWHYIAAVEATAPRMAAPPLVLSGNLGAGASQVEFERFSIPPGPGQGSYEISRTYFTLNGGVRLAVPLIPAVGLLASAQGYWSFVDREDTRLLEFLGEGIPSVGPIGTFPLTLGVRVQF